MLVGEPDDNMIGKEKVKPNKKWDIAILHWPKSPDDLSYNRL